VKLGWSFHVIVVPVTFVVIVVVVIIHRFVGIHHVVPVLQMVHELGILVPVSVVTDWWDIVTSVSGHHNLLNAGISTSCNSVECQIMGKGPPILVQV
jgi:hypothetical protein